MSATVTEVAYPAKGRLAGFFQGDVEVTGDIRWANADYPEQCDIADADLLELGTVMMLEDEAEPQQSHQPYDKHLTGIISGLVRLQPRHRARSTTVATQSAAGGI